MELQAPQRPGATAGRISLACVVELALRHLGFDAVFIAELSAGGDVYREAAGDTAAFGIEAGEYGRVGSYCRAVSESGIPVLVADTRRHELLDELSTAHGLDVGAVIAVPLRLVDGSPFGVLCGLCRRPRPDLDRGDVALMAKLGELIGPELSARRRQSELRMELHRILTDEDVKVAFQPIIDLRTSRCIGVEALARFPAPFARPDWTLCLADEFGMRLALEELIVIEAWEMLDRLAPDQFLALNLAPDALIELARRAHLRDDLPLGRLVVEVTEHAAVDSYEPLLRELGPLRDRGLRIAVDDAGAGFASLRHVLELRPDFVKVDRSLIDGVATDHGKRSAVRSFISLASDLGARVVAEGVERTVDLQALRRLGVDAAQGFLLRRPTTDRRAALAPRAVGARVGRPRTRPPRAGRGPRPGREGEPRPTGSVS